jgi:Domain of unknown function (DUF3854)
MTLNYSHSTKIPSYSTAGTIAGHAGYEAEFAEYLKANGLVNVRKHRLFLDFDRWRAAYPDIPSYESYLASLRNSTTVISTRKSHITFADGLKIANRFDLSKEYHAAFPDNSAEINFWQWIKQYPNIPLTTCQQILRSAPITEWDDFKGECIEGSGISPALFALNTQHIVNSSDRIPEHYDPDDFDGLAVQCALNIPHSRSYESKDGLNWNRPELLFGGAIYAFVSSFSGFFNAKPRIPLRNPGKLTWRKYESRRKHPGNRVVRPAVSETACLRLVYQFNLDSIVTPENYWETVFAQQESIRLVINANDRWAARDVENGIPTIAILGKNPRYVSGSSELLELLPTINSPGAKELELFLDREEGNKIFRPAVDQDACDRMAVNFDLICPTSLTAGQIEAVICKIVLAKTALNHQLATIEYLDLTNNPIAPENYRDPLTPDKYWETILEFPKLISIGIAEGAKKALSLCTQGFPCLAILGVTNWSVSGSSDPRILHPEIAQFVTGGRNINIWFDRDNPAKITTIRNVRSQGIQLSKAINQEGGKPQLMGWDRDLGKGIDDAIVTISRQGLDVGEWLRQTIEDSRGFLIYEQIAPMYELGRDRTIVQNTQGNYIPFDLRVQPQEISVLIADTGSGKTYRINELIQKCKSLGTFVVIFTPTNKMGKQAAKNFGLPHRNSHYDMGEVIAEARRKGGLVLCPDSIQYVLAYLKKVGQPYVVVFDEAAKVAEHITTGNTIKERYSEVNAATAELVAGAQSVIIAEAKISESTIRFYEQISGKKAVVYLHKRVTNKRKIKMYKGALASINAQTFQDICDALDAGEKVIICSDSQVQGEAIHRMLVARFPHLRGMRNDAHTSYLPDVERLTTSPNEFLAEHQLDYLIYSPACKAGWDLTGKHVDEQGVEHRYNFTKIFAFFTVLPTSDHIQMIARWREYADVIIACPEFISLGTDENFTKKMLQEWREHQITTNVAFCKVLNHWASPIQQSIDDLYVHNTVRNGLEKGIARYSLMRRLQDDGHTVTVEEVKLATLAETDPARHKILHDLAQESTTVRVQIEWETAETIAATKLSPENEALLKIAEDIERMEAPTPQERATARKIRLRLKFPRVLSGAIVDFDNATDVYYTIREYGKLGNGADLHAKMYYAEAIAAQQRDKNGYLLKEDIVAAHHLGYEYQRVKLLIQSGILDLLGGLYSKDSPEILQLQAFCLKYRREFKQYFKFDFTEIKSPISYWTVLIRKLGLLYRDKKMGKERTRHYFVLDLDTARANFDRYSEKVLELEEDVAAKITQIEEEIALEAQLSVQHIQTSAQLNELLDLRQSGDSAHVGSTDAKASLAQREQNQLQKLLLRIERQQIDALRSIDRLDDGLERIKLQLARCQKQADKSAAQIVQLELRPRLFAAASLRLDVLSTKLLDSPHNRPVPTGIEQKFLKVSALQCELPLKLPPS